VIDHTKDGKKMQDMSVDEILKSIRKVIEKTNHKESIRKEDRLTSPHTSEDDLLELTEVVELGTEQETQCYDESLISDRVAEETSGLFRNFAQQATEALKDCPKRGQTLEDFVVEMMKPQLKLWLDSHLPSLVRELVEKEIKRLVPSNKEE
jgi:hypothetical protein